MTFRVQAIGSTPTPTPTADGQQRSQPAPAVALPRDGFAGAQRALDLVNAGLRRPAPSLVEPTVELASWGQKPSRAWHLQIANEAQMRELMDVLSSFRDVVYTPNIGFKTSERRDAMPTRTILIPIVSRDEQAARRHALMDVMEQRFGLERHANFETHGLIISLNWCHEENIDLDRFRVGLERGSVDDATVRDIFSAQGQRPPSVPPEDPYVTGPDVQRGAKDPRCFVA